MPLHALYDPRRSHELVIDAKGRLVTTSCAEPDGSPYPRNVGFHKDLRDRYQGLYV